MVSREQARAIAEEHLARGPAEESWNGVRTVVTTDELAQTGARPPRPYGVPVAECWVAYVGTMFTGTIGSSVVVLVDRTSGRVVYSGGANDEG